MVVRVMVMVAGLGFVARAAADPAPEVAPGSAHAAQAAELVINPVALKPGTSSTVDFLATLDLDFNYGGQATVSSTTRTKKKKVEIRAVDRDGTVHKRITYSKIDTNSVVDGERRKDPSTIRGKTYDLTWNNGILDVRRPGGKAATPDEITEVHGEEGTLQAPELMSKLLAGVRLTQDQPFEVPVAMLESMVKTDYRPRRVVLTYRGKASDGERVDGEATLVKDGQGMKMFLDLDVKLVFDATGWCLSARVAAKVRAELNGTVVGSGAGTASVVATPLR
jgi:hypothetical protein